MSHEAVTAVFAMRGLSSTEKLVALRFAEKAHADGTNTYPSAVTVAEDTGLKERAVRYAIVALVKNGVLVPDGWSPLRTRKYRIDLTAQPAPTAGDMQDVQVQEMQGASDAGETCTPCRDDLQDVHPNHPVPVQEPSVGLEVSKPKTPAKRKTRLPDPFMLNGDMRRWAEEHTPGVNVRAETEKFVDHFRGSGVPKLDWVATWRNWMRRAVEMSGNGHKGKASVGADTVDALAAFAREDG